MLKIVAASAVAIALTGCAMLPLQAPTLSTLVDLDPVSTERTFIIEGLATDLAGRLYTPDRVSGNVLRIDPRDPKPVVVGRIPERMINGRATAANGGSLVFDAQGNLLIAAAGFGEVVRLHATDLDPARPGTAQTFATGVPGANGITLDRQGRVYVSGGASGIVYRIAPQGGAPEPVVQIERFTRTLPDGRTQQAIVANGLAFDAAGVLHVADTARGAIWRVAFDADGKAQRPVQWVQDAALQGADGINFDSRGRLWVTANELNALARVSPAGEVSTVASNGVGGPLEFPSAVVFVGDVGYVANFDVPRRVNVDEGSANTSRGGIGASLLTLRP